MKRISLLLFSILASFTALAQNYTETRQLRLYPINKAADTAATVGNDGRMWYDFSTDEYRGIRNGVRFSFADASNVGGRYSNFYVVTTISALQTYLASLGAGADVNIWFPAGTYTVTTSISISNKGKVRIWSEGATLTDGLTGNGDVFNISTVTEIWVRDIKINLNLNNFDGDAIDVSGCQGPARFEDIDIFNFNDANDFGIRLNQVPRNAANNSGFPYPGTIFNNCSFYNPLTQSTTFNYNSNNSVGIGIYLSNTAEYYKIQNCTFLALSVGVWAVNGANGTIDNCEFNWNLPRIAGVLYGAVYVEDNATNQRKIGIFNSKFNHNWAYCISSNSNQSSPLIIANNYFIQNAARPIALIGSDANQIYNNYFSNSATALTATNNPFVSTSYNYILLSNSSTTQIQGNFFTNQTNGEPAIAASGTSDFNTIKNNYYQPGLTFTSIVGSNNNVISNEKKVTFQPISTESGMNAGSLAGDPSSLVNGDLWYNSSLGALRARIGGSTVSLGTGTIGGTIAATQVGFGSGANTLTSSANLTYNTGTDRLTAVGIVSVGSGFEVPYFNGSGTVIPFFNGGTPQTMVNDPDLTFTSLTNTLNVPNISSSGTITGANVTASTALTWSAGTPTRVPFLTTAGLYTDDADFTFTGGNTLNATNATIATNLTWSAGTATRIPFLGTAGLFDDDNGLTYDDASNLFAVANSAGTFLTQIVGGEIKLDDIAAGDELTMNYAGLQFSGTASPPQILNSTATGSVVLLDNVVYTNTSTSGNVGTGNTTIYTFSLPAATLFADGQTLRIEVWYDIASNTNVKSLTITVGGTTVASTGTLNVATQDYGKITVDITRTSATAGLCMVEELTSRTTTFTGNIDLLVTSGAAITWANANTVNIVAASNTASNDIIGQFVKVYYYAQ